MVVKENPPTLYQAIVLLFEQPPWLGREQATEYQIYPSLESSTALNAYVDWLGVGHAAAMHTHDHEDWRSQSYGEIRRSQEAGAEQLEQLWRRH